MSFRQLKTCFSIGLVGFTLAACGGGSKKDSDLNDSYAYKSSSPYVGTIEACASAETRNDYCTLATLPVIGMEHENPSIADIMDRVVVSHEWMGQRFEALLEQMPPEMLPLFKALTAIVIDADIRPAYYAPATGAIYLDPAFLWLSVAEKITINPKQDYRAGFDDPLAFRQLNRYTVDGQPAYRWASLTDESTREMDDIKLLAARLLLHELAHANDFIPPGSYKRLNTSLTVSDAADSIINSWLSTRLIETEPLISDRMFSLAGVMYLGYDPSMEDLETTAFEVGEAFEFDGAGDDYAYSSQYEDLAMLFETAMMKYFFDADYEIAFTGVPEDPSLCNAYQIGWGTRNRIGDMSVRNRAEFAASEVLPSINFGNYFESVEPASEISGDWCLSSEGDSQQKMFDAEIQTIRPYL